MHQLITHFLVWTMMDTTHSQALKHRVNNIAAAGEPTEWELSRSARSSEQLSEASARERPTDRPTSDVVDRFCPPPLSM